MNTFITNRKLSYYFQSQPNHVLSTWISGESRRAPCSIHNPFPSPCPFSADWHGPLANKGKSRRNGKKDRFLTIRANMSLIAKQSQLHKMQRNDQFIPIDTLRIYSFNAMLWHYCLHIDKSLISRKCNASNQSNSPSRQCRHRGLVDNWKLHKRRRVPNKSYS